MNRARRLVAAAVVLAFAPAVIGNGAWAVTASWNEQLHQMIYLLVYTSSINVINGLHLTQEQAERLRDLALDVERAALPPPDFSKSLPPDVAVVCNTYRDLAEMLKSGEAVSEALNARVLEARAVESRIIRDSLQYAAASRWDMRCSACHKPPQRGPKAADNAAAIEQLAGHAREVERGHIVAVYGVDGARLLPEAARAIDGILTEAQKVIFEDFSCCLVPPSDLSDPVRIGQADAPDRLVKMLERVREIPALAWRVAGPRLTARLVDLERVKKPDLTESQEDQLRARLEHAFEEARTLADVDFELKKRDICRAMNPQPNLDSASFAGSYQRAYFLMLPGTAELYEDVIARRPPE